MWAKRLKKKRMMMQMRLVKMLESAKLEMHAMKLVVVA